MIIIAVIFVCIRKSIKAYEEGPAIAGYEFKNKLQCHLIIQLFIFFAGCLSFFGFYVSVYDRCQQSDDM